MLAPLLVMPRHPRDAFPAFRLGRGQILALTGDDWEPWHRWIAERCAETGIAFDLWRSPAAGGRAAEAEGAPLLLAPLPAGGADPEALDAALRIADARAERGGGALLFAPSLPADDRIARFPGRSEEQRPATLLDDAGQPAAWLRAGMWGTLRFPWVDGLSEGPLALRLLGAGGELRSPDCDLGPWGRFAPAPRFCEAVFAAPADGDYRAILLSGGRAAGGPLPLRIRPSSFSEPSPRLSVDWRLAPRRAVLPRVAQRMHERPAPATLDLADDSRSGLRGDLQPPETGAFGVRRWVGAQCRWLMRGRGPLRIRVDDRRPRVAALPGPAIVRVEIEGGERREFTLHLPGEQALELGWPADGLNHEVSLSVMPVWSPRQLALNDDARPLGLLLNGASLDGPASA